MIIVMKRAATGRNIEAWRDAGQALNAQEFKAPLESLRGVAGAVGRTM